MRLEDDVARRQMRVGVARRPLEQPGDPSLHNLADRLARCHHATAPARSAARDLCRPATCRPKQRKPGSRIAFGAQGAVTLWAPMTGLSASYTGKSMFESSRQFRMRATRWNPQSWRGAAATQGSHLPETQSLKSDNVVSKTRVATIREPQPSENPLRTTHWSSERSVLQ